MKYNLTCLNHLDVNCEHKKECGLCDVKGDVLSDYKVVVCPISHQKLKLMGENNNGVFLKMSSMTKDQRKNILIKRSRKHFQKEIKEKADTMHKDMIKASTKK